MLFNNYFSCEIKSQDSKINNESNVISKDSSALQSNLKYSDIKVSLLIYLLVLPWVFNYIIL